LDFGLAKLTETAPVGPEDSTLTARQSTELGMIVGTAAYMSPEQAEGKKVDARSDIFSFGSVLYEMLTGRRAFQRDSSALTLAAILHLEPPPFPAEIPQELERVVARCLRKDPARRFQTMADLKVTLEEMKEESDSGKLAPAEPRQAARRWR
jgi:serine/threonine protein kinase